MELQAHCLVAQRGVGVDRALAEARRPAHGIFGAFFVGFQTPTLASVSELVTFRNWNEPLQTHLLALTDDPMEMM